jgi:hypothetical protein
MQPSTGSIEFTADDGTVSHGPEAQAAWEQYVIQAEGEHRGAVQSLAPTARRAYAQYKRTGVLPKPQVRTTPRPRGAGRPAARRSAQRSSARSGDSGDSEGSEPPARGRRLNGRQEINEWVAERKRVLDALTQDEHPRLDGEVRS